MYGLTGRQSQPYSALRSPVYPPQDDAPCHRADLSARVRLTPPTCLRTKRTREAALPDGAQRRGEESRLRSACDRDVPRASPRHPHDVALSGHQLHPHVRSSPGRGAPSGPGTTGQGTAPAGKPAMRTEGRCAAGRGAPLTPKCAPQPGACGWAWGWGRARPWPDNASPAPAALRPAPHPAPPPRPPSPPLRANSRGSA